MRASTGPASRSELLVVYLAVTRACQRRGVGRQLLDFARGTARTEGRTSIVLEVREKNEAARRFFLAQGFKEESLLRSALDPSLGQGARILLRLPLPPPATSSQPPESDAPNRLSA
jgi:ribosomal-protein-alanine N-acetyltransferase